jgi:transposase
VAGDPVRRAPLHRPLASKGKLDHDRVIKLTHRRWPDARSRLLSSGHLDVRYHASVLTHPSRSCSHLGLTALGRAVQWAAGVLSQAIWSMSLVFPRFGGVALLDSVLPNERSSMGRRGYPPEFRRRVLDLVEADRSVADVARDLGISDQSVYAWRRQDRIDRGLVPGLTSSEKSELAAAKRRIAELETELHAVRRAIELVREVVPPKGGSRRSR